MLPISNTFDTASIHAAGSTSWLDERTTSARRALDERSSSQLVEPASSCKRGISEVPDRPCGRRGGLRFVTLADLLRVLFSSYDLAVKLDINWQ